MRTTVTLEDDVSRFVEEAMRREGRSFKDVVNDALRRALSGAPPSQEPVELLVHRTTLLPGFDRGRLNQLNDELEVDAFLDARR